MKSLKAFVVALAASAAGCGGQAATTPEPAPAKTDASAEAPAPSEGSHPYAGAKVDFYVKYKVVIDMGFMKLDKEVTRTVVEAKADHVLVVTITRMPNAEDVKVTEKFLLNERPARPKVRATGTERITVPAGDFDCTWVETEVAGAGGVSVTRTWLSEDIITHVVKMEINDPKTKYTWELIDFFVGN